MNAIKTQNQIYLASKSPQRRKILEQMGVDYTLIDINISEQRLLQEQAHDYVVRIALEKARAATRVAGRDHCIPILGSDTIVVIDNTILTKPRDFNDAVAMLQRLSGCCHKVLTAVTVIQNKAWSQMSETDVTFRKLTDEEIEAYCITDEPWDKAGAYGIQGKAAIFIKKISGSYTGVMGLPIYETAYCLQLAGIDLFTINEQ